MVFHDQRFLYGLSACHHALCRPHSHPVTTEKRSRQCGEKRTGQLDGTVILMTVLGPAKWLP